MRFQPVLVLIAPVFVLWTALALAADAVPTPPCGAVSVPAYPQPDLPPTITVVHRDELARAGWHSPSCAGWPESFQPTRIVALAGSFRFDGDIGDLLTRVGAVQTLANVQYWSASEKKWKPLVNDASALEEPDPKTRRGDFSAGELAENTKRHYWVDDSRFGQMTYEQEILARGPERAVIATRNITPVTFFIMTLFAPDELRSAMFVEKLSPGVWGLYLMLGTNADGWLLDGYDAAFVNRAVALYRHTAGIRTDLEPPAFR